MAMELPRDLELEARRKIHMGLYNSSEELLREAFRLLEERDRRWEKQRDRLVADFYQDLVEMNPELAETRSTAPSYY